MGHRNNQNEAQFTSKHKALQDVLCCVPGWCMMYIQCLRKFSLLGIYLSFLMRHQSTKPVSPAPGDFLLRAHHPQEVDQRGVYDGLRVQIEANKKLIRDVIISRAGRCRPCQDLNYFAGFLIELFFVLNLFSWKYAWWNGDVDGTRGKIAEQEKESKYFGQDETDLLINCWSFVLTMTPPLFYNTLNVFKASRKCIIIKIWWLSYFLPQICPRFFTNCDH